MKKYPVLFLLFCLAYTGYSQGLMTVGEVYDYDPGDIFITKGGGYYAPPTYTKTIILSKYFNVPSDSVFYIIDKFSYTPAGCPTCAAVYDTTYGDTLAYTNLNDTIGSGLGVAPFYWNPLCIDTAGYTGVWVDSVYYDTTFCNRQITLILKLENGPFLDDTCYWYFEPFFGYDEYGAGIGHKEHYYNTCSGGNWFCEEKMELLYYKKGLDSCGTAPLIPLPIGIYELGTHDELTIEPNPFSDFTQLSFAEEQINSQLFLFNLTGSIVKSFRFNGSSLILEKEKLSEGTYFVRIINRDKVYSSRLIIQ